MTEEQKHGLGWFYGRWERIFNSLDKNDIRQQVTKLIQSHPEESKKKLAIRIIKNEANISAVAGMVSAFPALFPGIGTAVSILAIAPEEIYLIRRQCAMLLQISSLYGFDPADEERLYEIVAMAGSPVRSIDAMMVAKYDLRGMAAKAASHLSIKAGRKAALGAKTASRGILRRLPALGFFVGGAINYQAFRSLGKTGRRFYENLEKKERKGQEIKKLK